MISKRFLSGFLFLSSHDLKTLIKILEISSRFFNLTLEKEVIGYLNQFNQQIVFLVLSFMQTDSSVGGTQI